MEGSLLVGTARLLSGAGIDTSAGDPIAAELSGQGKTAIMVAVDGRAAGVLAVADTVKPESAAAIAALRELGTDVVMITGDNAWTAAAIAAEVGVGRVLAEVLPEHKAGEIARLQAEGRRVGMVGDGINAPCGMTVSPESAAATREVDGTTYYFCSAHCANTFDADQARYTATAALVRNPVNGTVLILFIWIVDVFFGPTMGSSGDKLGTRLLPTHYVTVWMGDLPLRHGGRLGDLGVALVWVVGAMAVAFAVVATTVRVARRHGWRVRPGSVRDQLAAATRMGWRDWRRNPVLWALLVAVPAVFILLAQAITPHRPTSIVVAEDGSRGAQVFDVFDLHAGTMVPIAVASLATLAGLFVVLDTGRGDRRLALVGLRPGVALAARLAVVGIATALATGVSLAVAALVFDPRQWVWYAAANALIAATYALLGVLIAPIFGRVAGVFIAFLIPFIDVGIGQSPMLRGEPTAWAQYLPGYGGYRILIDAGLTGSFDEARGLLVALGWIAALAIAATVLVRRTIRPTTR